MNTNSEPTQKTLFALVLIYTVCIYGPIAMMSIGAGLLFAVWLSLAFLKKNRPATKFALKEIRKSPFFWPTLFLGAGCLWSLIWSDATHLDFMGLRSPVDWKNDPRKLWHLVYPLFFAVVLVRLSSSQVLKALKLWMALGLASAILGVVQHYIPIYKPLELPDVGLRGLYHATGMTSFHLSYASILVFPTCVWIGMLAIAVRRKERWTKIALLTASSAVFFVANVFTYSKITWVSVPIAVLFLALLGFRGWARYSIIVAIFVFGLAFGTSKEVHLRFRGTDSIKERIEVWNANWEMVKAHPVFGVGWHRNVELTKGYYDSKEMKGFISHAHNNLLDQWASTGVFGLLGYLWWSVVAVVLAYFIYRDTQLSYIRAFGLGIVGGWIGLQLNGLTQCNFWDAKVLHQIAWVAAFTIDLYRRRLFSEVYNK